MNSFCILTKILRNNRNNCLKLFSLRNVTKDCNQSKQKELSFNDFKCLAINKSMETKIKLILNEYLVYKSREEDMNSVPSTLTVDQMRQLLNCHHMKRRGRFWTDDTLRQRKHLLYLMKRSEDVKGYNRLTAPLMPNEVTVHQESCLAFSVLFSKIVHAKNLKIPPIIFKYHVQDSSDYHQNIQMLTNSNE